MSLVASVVLLATFVVIEGRSKHALVPFRVLRNRNRSGAYVIMLCVGTAMFGMFFFLTLFIQQVWGYSPIESGIAYLPFVGAILVATGLASQLVPRIGARPLMLIGATMGTGGLFWLSRVTAHSTYVNGLLGAMIVTAFGFGLMFVPLSLIALSKVREEDTGVASSLLNTGQQVGGSIGLAILGTVAWSAVANNAAVRVRRGGQGGGRGGQGRPSADQGPGGRGEDADHPQCHRLRLLARVRGLGGDRAAGAGRHDRHDPGHAPGPGRRQPDGRPGVTAPGTAARLTGRGRCPRAGASPHASRPAAARGPAALRACLGAPGEGLDCARSWNRAPA